MPDTITVVLTDHTSRILRLIETKLHYVEANDPITHERIICKALAMYNGLLDKCDPEGTVLVLNPDTISSFSL